MRRLACLTLWGLLCVGTAHATPVPLDDRELSAIDGRDGVTIGVHLQLSTAGIQTAGGGTQLVAGFRVNGVTTYAVVQDLGGTADLFAVTLDVRAMSGGGSYLDIGLPTYIGFSQFGFRALGAQTNPQAVVTSATSYGQVLLNGTASATGHIYLWATP